MAGCAVSVLEVMFGIHSKWAHDFISNITIDKSADTELMTPISLSKLGCGNIVSLMIMQMLCKLSQTNYTINQG